MVTTRSLLPHPVVMALTVSAPAPAAILQATQAKQAAATAHQAALITIKNSVGDRSCREALYVGSFDSGVSRF